LSPGSARDWGADPASLPLPVGGARLVRLHAVEEARGLLTVGEAARQVPFEPRRYFVVSEVPDENIRGEHAHLALHQFLVCLAGRVTAEVDDGRRRAAIVLDTPRVGLYMPPLTWGAQHHYSRDAVLLVLASHEYDAADYVRDYPRFLELAGATR
jgi:UDP-2-acetamido-3-amino-2,3-dideoxy-glucuronate N-acetyltransferase